MSAGSATPEEKARKYHALVLQRLAGAQTHVAAALGVHDSTVSRAMQQHGELLMRVLAHVGLKVVPREMRCYPDDKMEAILTLARAHLQTLETARQLAEEE